MKTITGVAGLAAVLFGLADIANAHSFNVALVIAHAGSPADGNARQVRDGFLLATRERDSHPDEESDGHLGGLDVYLHTIDLGHQSLAELPALLDRVPIDVLAVVGSAETAVEIAPLVDGTQTVLMAPGRLRLPLPEAFAAAFETAFGYPPGEPAAQGYNAGRRIDAAVRPLGGVDDRAALRRTLDRSRDGLDW